MGRRRKGIKIDGWIIIDKPLNVTSTDIVRKVKRLTKAQKLGHGGTLDPLASGILPLGLGEATKAMPYIVDATKDYEFTVQFGHETTTDDLEGDMTQDGGPMPAKDAIIDALPHFTGTIEQAPPAYSAIKIDGERAYDLARAGEAVVMKTRPVSIHSLTMTQYDAAQNRASFVVTCGKGTYIRSLGRDMARHLGSYGHICHLRRTRVGPFSLDKSISLEKFESFSHSAPTNDFVLPVMTALDDILALAVTDQQAEKIRFGQALSAEDVAPDLPDQALCLLVMNGELLAIAQKQGKAVRSLRVFNL